MLVKGDVHCPHYWHVLLTHVIGLGQINWCDVGGALYLA